MPHHVAAWLPFVQVEGTQELRWCARNSACILLLHMHTRQPHTPYLYRCATIVTHCHISPGKSSPTETHNHLTNSVKCNIYTRWHYRYRHPLASDLAYPPLHAIAFFRSDLNWSDILLHAPHSIAYRHPPRSRCRDGSFNN